MEVGRGKEPLHYVSEISQRNTCNDHMGFTCRIQTQRSRVERWLPGAGEPGPQVGATGQRVQSSS